MKMNKALALTAALVPLAFVGFAVAFTAGTAGVGNGLVEMDTFLSVLISWISGPLGTILAIAALTIGLAIGVTQQSLMAGAVGLFFAAIVNYGPDTLQGVSGAAESAL
jgi:hypothetical protein